MGNQQPNGKKDDKDKEKKKYEAPIPTRVGKKKRVKGPDMANKLPEVKPYTKCRLRLLKMERIKVSMFQFNFCSNTQKGLSADGGGVHQESGAHEAPG